MEDYEARFSSLIDRKHAELTEDDRDSLTYYYESADLSEGMAVCGVGGVEFGRSSHLRSEAL